jgi:hypothetical protein
MWGCVRVWVMPIFIEEMALRDLLILDRVFRNRPFRSGKDGGGSIIHSTCRKFNIPSSISSVTAP